MYLYKYTKTFDNLVNPQTNDDKGMYINLYLLYMCIYESYIYIHTSIYSYVYMYTL
jgi:hypothetical protein